MAAFCLFKTLMRWLIRRAQIRILDTILDALTILFRKIVGFLIWYLKKDNCKLKVYKWIKIKSTIIVLLKHLPSFKIGKNSTNQYAFCPNRQIYLSIKKASSLLFDSPFFSCKYCLKFIYLFSKFRLVSKALKMFTHKEACQSFKHKWELFSALSTYIFQGLIHTFIHFSIFQA